MTMESMKPVAINHDDDRLISLRETAEKLGYTYKSFCQARVENRVLLEEVRPSEGEYCRPKYRLSDVNRAIRGEIKAMKSAPFSEAAKERARQNDQARKARAERKVGAK
jgi:hypothetical protein